MMFLSVVTVFAQKPIDKMTKEDIMAMSYDQLADLPLDDLMRLADIVGVSIDDLFNMVLNKDVSIASKSSESFFDTPLSTSVLSAEDIARSGVLSIPEAMRLIPGVIVREKTNGNYDIHIRGNDNVIYGNRTLNSENTLSLVMIDGRVVYNYSTGGTFWESLPIGLNDVDRIELVRGPASALYGPNAVSGVINIITKKVASKKPSVEAGISSGNLLNEGKAGMATSGIQNLSISTGLTDKLKFRLSGNYDYRGRTQEDIYMWGSTGTPGNNITENGYYPASEIAQQGFNSETFYTDPSLSIDKYGINAYVFYNPNQDVNIDFAAGTQRSIAVSSNIDAGDIAHTTREMETEYVDLRASAYGFDLQANYLWGYQNVARGTYGLEFDLSQAAINIDYNIQLLDNRLKIRPGFSYSNYILNDLPYIQANERYYVGEKVTLKSYAPSVRVDYAPIEQLRLIGAFRYEKNALPDRAYPTWQFVANYKLQDATSVRAVYSRANRSPFILDVVMNMNYRAANIRPSMPAPFNDVTYAYAGNKNVDLAIMDMFELGYRQKLGRRMMLNMELFHSILKDMNGIVVDELNVATPRSSIGNYPVSAGLWNAHYSVKNLKSESRQYGVTAEIGVVVNKKLNLRMFGTLQTTDLKNHDDMSNEEKIDRKYDEVSAQWNADGVSWANPVRAMEYAAVSHTDIPERLINTNNKMTPSFYGGFEVNYVPVDKLSITSTAYGFTKQTFIHAYGTYDIPSKMLVNLRVAYKFMRTNSVFMTANNIFNSKTTEFGFMDKTGIQLYWGVSLSF